MSRERFLKYKHDTNRDETLKSITMAANFLYIKLAANDDMNAAGVLPLIPVRFTRLASDMSTEAFWTALAELQAANLVLVDEETGEAMVRSYARHSKVMYSPNRVKNLARVVWPTITSTKLRAQLIIELARVKTEDDNVNLWFVLEEHAKDLHDHVMERAEDIRILRRLPELSRVQEALEISDHFEL